MEQTDPPAKVASNDQLGLNDPERAKRGLQALRVVLGIDSPEVRGWAPVVQQEARRAIDRALAVLPLPDHDNHHNALKCQYCNPQRLVLVPQTPSWEPPSAWEIVRAAEEAGLEGLSAPYLSDGDRQITDAGKAFIKAARRVMVLYCRDAQRHDKAGL